MGRMAWQVRVALSASVGLLALAALAACGAEPQRDLVLTADPPLAPNGTSADDGAVDTELARGTAYVKNEKYAEAKEHFEKAIAIKPSALAWTYLGIADEKTGDRAAGEEAYKNALRLDPGFAEAAQNLGALYLDDPPRPDDAIAVLKPAVAKSADNARLLQNLGYAYGLKGDVDAAGKAYEAALAKGEDPQIRFAYGTLLVENKQPDRAASELRKALDATKDDPAMLASVGRLLGSVKAYGDCVRAFDRAIKLKAGEAELYVRRGTCKHELSDEDGAQQDYEAAIKADPKFAPGHYYLGMSRLAQKKRQTAVSELEKASQLGGDGPMGKAARAKLDELSQQGTKKKK
jgi:Flp pilus assembly protein TadD